LPQFLGAFSQARYQITNHTGTFTLLAPTVLKYLARGIRQEEEIKGIQIGKETVQISLFADDTILCLKDQKNPTQKLLDTMNSYIKVAGYKINLQKSLGFFFKKKRVVFLHSNK
jgi:hypothetical protein